MENMIAMEVETSTCVLQAVNGDLYSKWLAYIDVTPKSVETYKKGIKAFARYLQANGIQYPTRADILAYKHALQAENRKPSTIQCYITTVKQFFKWTAQEGIYPNIAENVKGVKMSKEHKKDYLTATQSKDILEGIDRSTAKGLRDYAVVVLMLTTGLRTIEVARADRRDLEVLGGSTVLYIQGKGREERAEYVKVAPAVEKAIRAYLATRTDQGAPLFTSTSHNNCGQRLTTRSISAICKETMQRAGYDSERLTAHSLRHTAGTLNLLNGGTLEETQQLLRHTNINTTMIYMHDLERANNQSENRIADAILNSGSEGQN